MIRGIVVPVAGYILKRKRRTAIILANAGMIFACQFTQNQANPPSPASASIQPVASHAPDDVPQFVGTDFVDLYAIRRISLFRSGEGHDYGDDFETCRSMKHYYQPYEDMDWSTIKIYSPVEGDVTQYREEWAGVQIHIQSTRYPHYTFMIFHLNPQPDMEVGYHVWAGLEIGSPIGNMTYLDVAVRADESGAYRLVSYFDVMTDELFQTYRNRGVHSKADLIISRAQRDADPLRCDGDTIVGLGGLPNWFVLH